MAKAVTRQIQAGTVNDVTGTVNDAIGTVNDATGTVNNVTGMVNDKYRYTKYRILILNILDTGRS